MNVENTVAEFLKTVENTRRFGAVIFSYIKEPAMKPHKLIMLDNLRVVGKSKLKDIAARIGQSPQNLCMMYNSFEKEGLVARETDPNDRRNTYYYVTSKATKLIEKNKKQAKDVVEDIFSKLSDEDINDLSNCLEKVNNIIGKLL